MAAAACSSHDQAAPEAAPVKQVAKQSAPPAQRPFERGARGFIEAARTQKIAPIAEFVHNRATTRFMRCTGDDCVELMKTRGFEEFIAYLYRLDPVVGQASSSCDGDCCLLRAQGQDVARLCFAYDSRRVSYLSEVRLFRAAVAPSKSRSPE